MTTIRTLTYCKRDVKHVQTPRCTDVKYNASFCRPFADL